MNKINLAKRKLFNLIFVKTKAFLIILICLFSFLSILISCNQKNKDIEQLISKTETAIVASIRDCEIRYDSMQNTISRLNYLDFPSVLNDNDGNVNFIVNSFPEIEYIAWVDTNFIIKEIYPFIGNESKLNKKASTFKVEPTIINHWGSVIENSSFQGFLFTSINVPKLLENCEKNLLNEFMIEIKKNGEIIYQTSNWQDVNQEFKITRNLSLQKSDDISFTCVPSIELTKAIQYSFYKTLLIAFMFSVLLVLTAFFAQKFYFASKLNDSRYKNLLDNAKLFAIILDKKGLITYCNDYFLSSTGWKRKEIIGNSFIQQFCQSSNKKINQLLLSDEENEDIPNNMEIPLITKNNETRWIRFNRTIQKNIKGEIIGFLALGEDITEQKRNAEALLKQYQFLKILFSIDQAITSREDISKTFSFILDEVNKNLESDAASILLYNNETNCLEYSEGKGFKSKRIQKTIIPIGIGPTGLSVKENKSVSVNNLQSSKNKFIRKDIVREEGFKFYHVEPLVIKDKIMGVIEVFFKTDYKRDDNWNSFIKAIAQQTAIVVDNSTLFNNLKNTNQQLLSSYESTIEGWSRALELRDRETENHSNRVTELTLKVCELYGMSQEELINIRRGALLHDIGKMGVPDSILLKKEKLTDSDWKVIRMHPQYAYDLIYPIEYLRPSIDIPYCHHEKWDGTGYPRGLKGTDIPLSARVFAIIDVWDALLSDRPYRDAWPREKVIAEIKRLSGTHFDPEAVKHFLQVIENME